jgi:Domain of unknown function (DUF4349)/Putative zinc-finger
MMREMIRPNHPIDLQDLMAYLDGELPADQASVALAHLDRCPECQTVVSDLRRVSRKLSAWEVEASHPRLSQNVTNALATLAARSDSGMKIAQRSWQDRFDLRRWSLRTWGVAAASMVGIAILAVASIPTMRRDALVSRATTFDRLEQFSQLQTSQQSAKTRTTELVSPGEFTSGTAISGPMIVRAAALTVTTRDFDQARSLLDDIVKRHHGYVGELNVTTPAGTGGNFTATLRVPADQLEATLADLKRLGRVESESQSGQEVTAQYVDLEARLSNARNTEERLSEVLRQRTGKLSDVLAVETEIARVRGEIEQMEAEKKTLANQVTFATISATVREDYEAQLQVVPPTTFGRLHNAAIAGYQDMAEAVVSTALFLLSHGPSLLLWGALLFFPARALWRRIQRNPGR